MRVRIHRGAHEMGGSCVEVAADGGGRIVLDLGRPLSAALDEEVELPAVPGLTSPDPSLLGPIISHPHLDHYGLATDLEVDVPTYIGAEAASLLDAAALVSPISGRIEPAGHLRDHEPIQLGPFTVVPYLEDHSAFDAYSLLVEADGVRLFYTGDLRAHGRKAVLFERLLAKPPPDLDVLLMEGTYVRADASHDDATFETESQLEERFTALCEDINGAVVTFGSVDGCIGWGR